MVPASELDRLAGLDPGTVSGKFAITQRRYAAQHETSSFMGARAAENALAEAGWQPDDIDVIIGACGVMEQPIPSTAVLIQNRLGLGESGIPAFDMNATCLSFLIALDRALAGFALGEWERALIVSSDIATAALDYSDPEASVLFSDGAAAFALDASGPHTRLAHRFATFGEAERACRLEAGGTRLRLDEDPEAFLAGSKFAMDGHAVFRATSRRFPGFLADLLADAETSPEEIAQVIPHQASASALEHLKRAIPDGAAKTIDVYADCGNMIAASLPYALHVARKRNLFSSGDRGLLIGSGAGISLGGAIIEW
nr:3-oxoacyl-[acyl-carrier-protein] synthase III C-terminal domain-containing protein [Erythrobacter sp. THAF29]